MFQTDPCASTRTAKTGEVSHVSNLSSFILRGEIRDIIARGGRLEGGEGEGKLPPLSPSHHSPRAPFLSHLSPRGTSAEERVLATISIRIKV